MIDLGSLYAEARLERNAQIQGYRALEVGVSAVKRTVKRTWLPIRMIPKQTLSETKTPGPGMMGKYGNRNNGSYMKC